MGAWLDIVTIHGFGVYRPAQRTRAWQQEVAVQVAGVTLPLLTLSAACLGTQLTLSTDNLPFGTVVLGSEVSNVFSALSAYLVQTCGYATGPSGKEDQ